MIDKNESREISLTKDDIRVVITYKNGVRDGTYTIHDDNYTWMKFSESNMRKLYDIMQFMVEDGLL